jgi:hypothetical protein
MGTVESIFLLLTVPNLKNKQFLILHISGFNVFKGNKC